MRETAIARALVERLRVMQFRHNRDPRRHSPLRKKSSRQHRQAAEDDPVTIRVLLPSPVRNSQQKSSIRSSLLSVSLFPKCFGVLKSVSSLKSVNSKC